VILKTGAWQTQEIAACGLDEYGAVMVANNLVEEVARAIVRPGSYRKILSSREILAWS
jgi:hypothetical protein